MNICRTFQSHFDPRSSLCSVSMERAQRFHPGTLKIEFFKSYKVVIILRSTTSHKYETNTINLTLYVPCIILQYV